MKPINDLIRGDSAFALRMANNVRHIKTAHGVTPSWYARLGDIRGFSDCFDYLNPDRPNIEKVKDQQRDWINQNAKGWVHLDERSYIIMFELEEDAMLWKLTFR